MNLFLFKVYIIRVYSHFVSRMCGATAGKSAFHYISEVQTVWWGGGGEESKGTNMEMKSSLVKVKTKTN